MIKILVRILSGADNEIIQVHYEFLARKMLELLKVHNSDIKLSGNKW